MINRTRRYVRHLPATFSRSAFDDMFPQLAGQVIVRTVFTMWAIVRPRGIYPCAYEALCACGITYVDTQHQVLRKRLGAHSCLAARGRPVELVPIDDVPLTSTLERVLSGLRASLAADPGVGR